MPLLVAKEHRDFFQKQGHIEFADLLTPAQVLEFGQAIEDVVSKKPEEKCATRDMWRRHPLIKKIVLKRNFAEVAASLTNADNIYLAYDQACGFSGDEFPLGMISLQQMSSVRPLSAGLLIRLTDGDMPTPGKLPCPCPTAPGHGVFFNSQLLVAWDALLELHGQHFCLIAYAGELPQYILEKRDPCTHALKQLGYAFGDTLSTTTHPLLFSR